MFWGTHLISKCGDLGWRNPDLGHTLKFRGHIVSEIERQSRDDQHLGAYFGRVDMGGMEMEILSEGLPSLSIS